MSQKLLIKQILTTLRSDTTLCSLTGHSSTNIRIARDSPPVKARTPFLGVSIFDSFPLLVVDVSNLQRARVWFNCYAAVELTVIDIADRVENLFHTNSANNTNYYDFSGGGVSTRMTLFRSRKRTEYDDKTDVWSTLLQADAIWVNSACP